MIDCILNASQAVIVDHVPGHSVDEQIAETLIKHDLGRHTRIGAIDNDRERMLTLCQLCAPFGRLTGMLQIAVRVTAIAFFQLGDRLRGSYRRLIRMGRIGRSSKLDCAKQTDYYEAKCEACLSHSAIL